MRIGAEEVARRAVALWRARSALYMADRCVEWPEVQGVHAGIRTDLCISRMARGDLDPGDACGACNERVRLKEIIRKAQRTLTSGVKSYAKTPQVAEGESS